MHDILYILNNFLSSPKGLRAESARAVTGRRCPHSGEGEDFLRHQPGFFFTKTAVTSERKVEESFPRWEMNNHSEGYKWVIDQNWGCMAKLDFWTKTGNFGPKKKVTLLEVHHVLATPGKSC